MKFKVTEKILDFNGEEIKRANDKALPLTYGYAIIDILNSFSNDEINYDPVKKFQHFVVCEKISKEDEPELTIEEIALILERNKKMSFPLLLGRIDNFLNQKV